MSSGGKSRISTGAPSRLGAQCRASEACTSTFALSSSWRSRCSGLVGRDTELRRKWVSRPASASLLSRLAVASSVAGRVLVVEPAQMPRLSTNPEWPNITSRLSFAEPSA